jgi:hypothetical protein
MALLRCLWKFEIDGLQRADGVLDAAETFIDAHRGSGIRVFGRQAGADHVDAVERSFGGDAEGVFGEAERVLADADLEMLGHVAPSQHCADRLADRRGAPRSGLRARCARRNAPMPSVPFQHPTTGVPLPQWVSIRLAARRDPDLSRSAHCMNRSKVGESRGRRNRKSGKSAGREQIMGLRMAGFSSLYVIGGEGGFMEADGGNSIEFLVLVGDADRHWLELHYLDNSILCSW